jgi:hypothetical protein
MEEIPSGSRHATLLDFTWWLAEQGTPHEVARLAIQQRLALQLEGKTPKVTAADAWGMFQSACSKFGDPSYRDSRENQESLNDSKQGVELVVERASAMTEGSLRWLRRPYLPLGVLAIIEGDPDLGKSTITLDAAASISRDRPWPAGTTSDVPGPHNALIVCGEDDWSNVIVPRLRAADADLDRIYAYRLRQDEHGHVVPLTIPDDLPRIRKAVLAAQARLAIFDPITAYLSERISTGIDPSVRRALEPLGQIAKEERCTMVMVRHLNKRGELKAMYRGGGSIAFSGVVRASFVVGEHPDEPNTMVFARVKANYVKRSDKLNRTYTLDSWSDDPNQPVVRWGELVELTADDLVKGKDRRKDAPRKQECKDKILEIFAAEGPEVPAEKMLAELEGQLKFSKKTIYGAKGELPIRDVRQYETGKKGVVSWNWVLAHTGPLIEENRDS